MEYEIKSYPVNTKKLDNLIKNEQYETKLKNAKSEYKHEIRNSGLYSERQQVLLLCDLVDNLLDYYLEKEEYHHKCKKNAKIVMIGLNNKIIDNPYPKPKTDRLIKLIKNARSNHKFPSPDDP